MLDVHVDIYDEEDDADIAEIVAGVVACDVVERAKSDMVGADMPSPLDDDSGGVDIGVVDEREGSRATCGVDERDRHVDEREEGVWVCVDNALCIEGGGGVEGTIDD